MILLLSRFAIGIELLHILTEFMTIFVGVMMFVVVNNTRHFVKNDLVLFLGIVYLAVAVIDTFHVLTMFGLPYLQINSTEVTLKFWVFARLFETTVLLSSGLFFTRKLNMYVMYAMSFLVVLLACLFGFYVEFPPVYTEGQLTVLKIGIELFIISILVLAATVFIKRRKAIEKVCFAILFIIHIANHICGNKLYTLSRFHKHYRCYGHVFKFFSFWFYIKQLYAQHSPNQWKFSQEDQTVTTPFLTP